VLGAGTIQPDLAGASRCSVLYGKFSVFNAGGRCGFNVGAGGRGRFIGGPPSKPLNLRYWDIKTYLQYNRRRNIRIYINNLAVKPCSLIHSHMRMVRPSILCALDLAYPTSTFEMRLRARQACNVNAAFATQCAKIEIGHEAQQF